VPCVKIPSACGLSSQLTNKKSEPTRAQPGNEIRLSSLEILFADWPNLKPRTKLPPNIKGDFFLFAAGRDLVFCCLAGRRAGKARGRKPAKGGIVVGFVLWWGGTKYAIKPPLSANGSFVGFSKVAPVQTTCF
jgi:hypothetical protein